MGRDDLRAERACQGGTTALDHNVERGEPFPDPELASHLEEEPFPG